VNLGSGDGYTIRQLIETMKEFIDFDFLFDPSKPAGFPRRIMDISRAREWINYEPKVSLREGLELTWNWFLNNKDEYLSKKNYFKE
jgi:GDP-L-fucose synthase